MKELSAPPGNPVDWRVKPANESRTVKRDGRVVVSVVVKAQTAWKAWQEARLTSDTGARLGFAEVTCTLCP